MKITRRIAPAAGSYLALSAALTTLAALILLPAATALCQEADDADKTLAADRRRARMLLVEAADAQGGKEILAALKSFHATFKLEVFDAERGRLNFDVERYFIKDGATSKLWTRKKLERGKLWSTIVWDGYEGWRISEEKDGKKEVVIFTDRPSAFRTDLDNIDSDVRLTTEWFQFFFVRTLLDKVPEMRYLREARIGTEPVHILEGTFSATVGKDESTVVLLRLALSKKENRVVEVRLKNLARGGASRTFRFDKYRRNSQGVLVSNNIKIFEGDEKRHAMQISLDVDFVEEKGKDGEKVRRAIPNIEFNAPIPESLFRIPEPTKK